MKRPPAGKDTAGQELEALRHDDASAYFADSASTGLDELAAELERVIDANPELDSCDEKHDEDPAVSPESRPSPSAGNASLAASAQEILDANGAVSRISPASSTRDVGQQGLSLLDCARSHVNRRLGARGVDSCCGCLFASDDT